MKCSFCKSEIEKGTGKIVIDKDSKQLHFCSRKCEMNMMKLKRNPKKVKWVVKRKE